MNKMTVKTQYISIFALVVAFMAFFGPFPFTANKAEAFKPIRLVDPFCIFSDCDEEQVIYQTINTNSNINSPGGVVNVNTDGGYDYNNDYDYDDDDDYWYGSLGVSCDSDDASVETGDKVTWRAYGYGGTGSYTYEWDGDEGLDGSGSSQTIRYDDDGLKRAEVTVRSGGRSVTRECSNEVRVYDNDDDRYDRDRDYDDDYDYDYYGPLSVSCSSSVTFAPSGSVVTWSTYVSGGNGRYSYRWDGTDGLRGSASSVSYQYINGGQKTAEVRVTSGGRSITRLCSNTVTVGVPVSQVQPTYNQVSYGGTLQGACFADRVNVGAGSSVVWAVEVLGGNGVYTYSWSGSDGLLGYGQSVSKTYSTSGSKYASVTVSSGAESKVISCGNTVAVGGYRSGGGNTGISTSNSDSIANVASSFFSLGNVPWAWVAIITILVLLTMVMYLLWNRKKI